MFENNPFQRTVVFVDGYSILEIPSSSTSLASINASASPAPTTPGTPMPSSVSASTSVNNAPAVPLHH